MNPRASERIAPRGPRRSRDPIRPAAAAEIFPWPPAAAERIIAATGAGAGVKFRSGQVQRRRQVRGRASRLPIAIAIHPPSSFLPRPGRRGTGTATPTRPPRKCSPVATSRCWLLLRCVASPTPLESLARPWVHPVKGPLLHKLSEGPPIPPKRNGP
jgi:hypothetical protein